MNDDRKSAERRLKDLQDAYAPYREQHAELAAYIAPRMFRADISKPRGRLDYSNILDPHASYMHRRLTSGLYTGTTSPARPWFKIGISSAADPDLAEYGPVRDYLARLADEIRGLFAASNFYSTMRYAHACTSLMGQYGGLVVDHTERLINCISTMHGQFWLGTNSAGRVDTLARAIPMTVDMVVREFGAEPAGSGSSIPQTIQNRYDSGDKDAIVIVYHLVEPRGAERDARNKMAWHKAWRSVYWLKESSARDGFLRRSGFSTNRIIAPRWDAMGAEPWGDGVMQDALPDVKQLQVHTLQFARAVDQMVDPTKIAPPELRGKMTSIPGKVIYLADPSGKSVRNAFDVNVRLSELDSKIERLQRSISVASFADLFMMFDQLDGVQPRNELEINTRQEEKLLQLGPVLERQEGEMFTPMIQLAADALAASNRLPPEPPELRGLEYSIEFISMLAQAQRAVSSGSVTRMLSFAGNLAGVKPDVMDKIDGDQAIDIMGGLLGVPPGLILEDDKVAEIRSNRAAMQKRAEQMQQMATMAPAAKQGADAARLLSEANQNGDVNALLAQLGVQA